MVPPWALSVSLALTILAIAIHLVGLGVFFYFLYRRKPRETLSFPGVTILKPCYLIEDREEDNYEVFFQQDYPGPLQLLFVASRPTDPAVALVRTFLQKYPDVDAELVISETRHAYWAKIDAVYDGHLKAKHDYFIISDSDASVRVDYVRNMVGALQEPGISLVSTPQWDRGANTCASGLKTLANNCDSAIFVLLAAMVLRAKIALGHSMAFRLSEFRALPGDTWKTLNSFLAEDVGYAHVFAQAGKTVALRNIYCPVQFSNKTLRQVYNQKVRWLLNQKMVVGNRYLYLLGVFQYPEVPALLYLLLTGFGPRGWLALGIAAAVRILVAFAVDVLYLGTTGECLRYFWTVPLWDLSQPYFFIHGFFKSHIRYGTKTYRVVDRYFLEEVDPVTTGAPVRSRWRAVFAPLLLVKSATTGLVATAVDLVALVLLVELAHVAPVWANVLSLSVGSTCQFLGHRNFVFSGRKTGTVAGQLSDFVAVEISAFVLNVVLYWVLLHYLPYLVAKLATGLIVYLGFSYPLWYRIFRRSDASHKTAGLDV